MPELAARLKRLDSVFAGELADRVLTLDELVQQLRQGSETALASLRRELHSLKGAARAVGATATEHAAHEAESIAHSVASGSRPDQHSLDTLRAAIDGLQAAAPAPIRIEAARTLKAATEERPPAEQNTVRVALSKLDALLTESGELSVTHLRVAQRLGELRDLQRQLERFQREWSKARPARARLQRAHAQKQTQTPGRDIETLLRSTERADADIQSMLHTARELVGNLVQNTAQLAAVAADISQEVIAIRLLPVGTIFLPMERLMRDLSRQLGKDTRLVIGGAETEIDRRMLDELRDPLLHMVRNTVDHGIEPADERLRAGKAAHGTLRLSALQRGDRVEITVEDDGRGLDIESIRQTAVRRNVVTAAVADQMDAATLIDLIFHPGFSTRQVVSEVSGRGVGMDVVREHVSRLGGDIGVRTTPGAGTSFTVTLPLTLATTRVLLVQDGGQTFAVPSSSIARTGRIRIADLQQVEGRPALELDGRPVPVVDLAQVLQRPPTGAAPAANEWRPFFVLPQGDRDVALIADRLVDETELVVKPLGAPLIRVRHVSGAAVLGTGAVVLILNPADLVKSAHGNLERGSRVRAHDVTPAENAKTRKRVLVVDDSVMTRTLERTILEAAGYSVVVAGDGAQALEVLHRDRDIDAILSDVEMPRMSGFELTAAVRQDERWRHLPIVLVTSLDSPEHIERGAAVGADAYIVKGRFDQSDLLQTVGRLL